MTYRALMPLMALLFSSGCFTAKITPAHQPQALMMDRGGELRASARLGGSASHDLTARGRIAYAPVDGFAVAGAVDVDPLGDDEHYGGELAIAAFLPHEPTLRLEIMGGLGAGVTEGFGEVSASPTDVVSARRIALEGPYLQPFVQGAVGFAVPYFEAGFGLRMWGSLVQVHAPELGTSTGYERLLVSPFAQLAVPVEWFRFETTLGMDLPVAGEAGPQDLGTEWDAVDFYAVFGIGIQLDLFAADPAYPEDRPAF